MKEKIFSIVLLYFMFIMLSINSVSAYNGYSYDWFGPALFGSCCFIYIFFLVIWILIGIWVYKDAEKRGKSGALWLIVVILLGIIGIIIWLIVRPPIPKTTSQVKEYSDRYCTDCGRSIPFDSKVCPYCGKKFEK